MASIAKITLLGRLGKDVELKQSTNGGQSFADFTLATDEPAGKQDGKQTYKTSWWSCRAFGQQAEYAGKWGKKGATVYLEGGVSVNEKDGKSYVNVKANVFVVVAQPNPGAAANNGASSQVNDSTTVEQPQTQQQAALPSSRGAQAAQRSAPAQQAAAPVATVSAAVAAEAAAADDDLPF